MLKKIVTAVTARIRIARLTRDLDRMIDDVNRRLVLDGLAA